MDRNTIRSGDKIQNCRDLKFCRLNEYISLVIQPLAIGFTWRYWLFWYYYRHGHRVSSLCPITEHLLFLRKSTEPPKHLLDRHIFGYTHHWSYS